MQYNECSTVEWFGWRRVCVSRELLLPLAPASCWSIHDGDDYDHDDHDHHHGDDDNDDDEGDGGNGNGDGDDVATTSCCQLLVNP